jgi:hypothetical protein
MERDNNTPMPQPAGGKKAQDIPDQGDIVGISADTSMDDRIRRAQEHEKEQ